MHWRVTLSVEVVVEAATRQEALDLAEQLDPADFDHFAEASAYETHAAHGEIYTKAGWKES